MRESKRFCAECCRPRRRVPSRRLVVSVLCIWCRFRGWRRDLLVRLVSLVRAI